MSQAIGRGRDLRWEHVGQAIELSAPVDEGDPLWIAGILQAIAFDENSVHLTVAADGGATYTWEIAVDDLVSIGTNTGAVTQHPMTCAEQPQLHDKDSDLWTWRPAGYLREDDGAPLTLDQLEAEFGPTHPVVA